MLTQKLVPTQKRPQKHTGQATPQQQACHTPQSHPVLGLGAQVAQLARTASARTAPVTPASGRRVGTTTYLLSNGTAQPAWRTEPSYTLIGLIRLASAALHLHWHRHRHGAHPTDPIPHATCHQTADKRLMIMIGILYDRQQVSIIHKIHVRLQYLVRNLFR